MVVVAADGHNSWVNSKALELAGITSATPDPLNGRIERDPQTNEPTGTLREKAMDLIDKVVPPSCDKAALRIFGLSLAGWNAVVSLVLAVIAFRGAKARG